MARRSRAREVALQVLYQDDLNPDANPGTADLFLRRRLQGEQPLEQEVPACSGVGGQGLEQHGLADPGLPLEEEQGGTAGEAVEGRRQARQLDLAPDQRLGGAHHGPERRGCATPRSG